MNEPLKILILDDEAGIVGMIEEALQSRGHHVRGETNPALALRALVRENFDLVLLDILMPQANGLSLISDIRKLQPGAAVVIVSALIDPHLAAVAAQEGSTMCLTKPIDWAHLDRVIQSVQPQQRSSRTA